MEILTGLLYINDVDAYTQYGVFLCEDSPDKNSNYAELLKMPAAKPLVSVNFPEHDGEKLPETITPALAARDLTLQFALLANGSTQFQQRLYAFGTLMKSGWLTLRLPELSRRYKVYYRECTDYRQITGLEGEIVARMTLKFREPNPNFNAE